MTGQRRVADDGVPHPRRPALLRRHLLPPARRPRHAELPPGARRRRRRMAQPTRRGRPPGRRAGRGHRPPHPRARRPRPEPPAPTRRRPRPAARVAAGGGRGRAGRARFDATWGGFGPAPKFPQPQLVELCLRHHRADRRRGRRSPWRRRPWAAMAAGGIYDHLGGGFARYSTDATLDGAALREDALRPGRAGAGLSCTPGRSRATARWLQVVEETVDYVLSDLASPGGGLYSAEDADSEGEEGRFYVWTPAEVRGRGGRRAGAVAAGLVRRHRGGQLRRAHHPAPSARRAPARGPPRSKRRGSGCSTARARAGPSRARRQGADRVERHVRLGAGRSGRGHRARGLGRARRVADRRIPAGRAAPTPTTGRWLRSWQDGRARHLAYAGRLRLARRAASPGWPSSPGGRVARPCRRDGAGHARALRRRRGPALHHRDTTPSHWWSDPLELLDGAIPAASGVAAAALLRLGALAGRRRARPTPASRCSTRCVPVAGAPSPGRGQRPWPPASWPAGASPRWWSPETGPISLAAVRARFEPTVVLAWGEPTSSPLWAGRDDGLAYVCRRLRLPGTGGQPRRARRAARRRAALAAERGCGGAAR